MKVLRQDIDAGQFKKIYLLCGDEAYLRLQWRDNLIGAMLPEGDTINLTRYEGKKLDVAEILSMAQTLPFFAQQRVVLVENSGFFKNEAAGLADGLADLPDTTCIIFVEAETDKRYKTYKTVKKLGYVAELNTPDTKMLVSWIGNLCKREEKQINSKCASYILEQCGTDMMLLSNEMEKLFSYACDRPVITIADVDAVCVNHVTGKIFEMMDAITMRQPERTISLYRDLLALKEEPIYILAMLTRQVRLLTEFKGLLADGVDYKELASKTKVPPFTVKKYVSQCKSYTYIELLQMYDACQDMDRQIKSGMVAGVIGVELMIVGFSQNRESQNNMENMRDK